MTILRAALAATATCGLAAGLMVAPGLMTATAQAWSTAAAPPRPVYGKNFADPGVVRTGNGFAAYATSGRVHMLAAAKASGPWRSGGSALPDLGPWADDRKGVWAPDVLKTSAGWVMYYSAVHRGWGDQRCIGVGTATSPRGPFQPMANPLICPGKRGAADKVPGRPVASAGVIDPAPFRASDGQRYVLYKTQKTPSSLRMFPVRDDGRGGDKSASRELVQRDSIIENPVMVQRSGRFVLFASRHGYNNCGYATVWMRSKNRWKWSGRAERKLMTSSGTRLCGPGGADVTAARDGGTRIFFHGWVCSNSPRPCTEAELPFTPPADRRALYAGVLGWGRDGATPRVRRILAPGA